MLHSLGRLGSGSSPPLLWSLPSVSETSESEHMASSLMLSRTFLSWSLSLGKSSAGFSKLEMKARLNILPDLKKFKFEYYYTSVNSTKNFVFCEEKKNTTVNNKMQCVFCKEKKVLLKYAPHWTQHYSCSPWKFFMTGT